MRISSLVLLAVLALRPWIGRAEKENAAPGVAAVEAIFSEHCLDCHPFQEPEHSLILETFEGVIKGGESGPAIVPGKSAESLLIRYVEGRVEKDGKKKIMPPGKRKKLNAQEITTLAQWIDAGAKGPAAGETIARRELTVPQITPAVRPRDPIQALAYAAGAEWLAAARYRAVELYSAATRKMVRRLTGARGEINAVAFSPTGQEVFGAGGEPARFREVLSWDASRGIILRKFSGHQDAIYALALSPDGKLLATGSYDQKIKLWETSSGREWKTLSGHNGAVFGLAFRPDGKILASASADRTVKLWDVQKGERKETLSQPLKEVDAVVFSPDGKKLYAGGVDNRIRVWQISDSAAETTNPLLESVFAHEGAILNLAISSDGKTLVSSADDRSVKLWDAIRMKEKAVLEAQPDWAHGLAVLENGATVAVGRMDGSLEFYDASSGQKAALPKPEVVSIAPRGIERGIATMLKLTGKHLGAVTSVKMSDPRLHGNIIQPAQRSDAASLWIELSAPSDLAPGPYELWLAGPAGESGRVSVYVDDLPQQVLAGSMGARGVERLPASVWGTFEGKGEPVELSFPAKTSQQLVLDLREKSLGSKATARLTIVDANGNELARSSGFDGLGEPLLAFVAPVDGIYRARIQEFNLAASPEHYFRLSMGAFPFVTDGFPLGISAHSEAQIELIGFNLPAEHSVRVRSGDPGELTVPIPEYRHRRAPKIRVSELPETVEREPNDAVAVLPMTTMAIASLEPIPNCILPRPRMGLISFACPIRAVFPGNALAIG